MKIQYASDLHLEFSENKEFLLNNPLIPYGDILILAGDIMPFKQMDEHQRFWDYCSENFAFTYWLPGNHEYYYSDINERSGEVNESIRENVFLVNNIWVNHGSVKLIFSTLWTNISMDKAWPIENGLNDFHLIKSGDTRFSVRQYNQLFEENLNFLKQAVDGNTREKCIVITHHVPTFEHYPEEFQNSSLNQAFAVDLNELMQIAEIDYWIYGHHHRNIADFKIGNTVLLTNQLGYVKANEHTGFSFNKIINDIF
jgi:predicted phosphohydrolase